jgi:hypothetical protein
MGEPSTEGSLARWWRGFVAEPLNRAQAEARANADGPGAAAANRKTLIVLVATALLLTLQNYLVIRGDFLSLAGPQIRAWSESLFGTGPLYSLAGWAIGCIVFYFVLPALIVKVVFWERLSDYGFKLRGAFADGWVYLVFFALVGPLVLIVSTNEHFQDTYPFYRLPKGEPLWPTFWAWELLYALQFLALEFFFRGFMVHGLRPKLGAYSIPVMMIPYCMIHMLGRGKPLPETLASILAGLALGFMSLRTRSVLLGAAIHISVALSMDFASLWRRGYFG